MDLVYTIKGTTLNMVSIITFWKEFMN